MEDRTRALQLQTSTDVLVNQGVNGVSLSLSRQATPQTYEPSLWLKVTKDESGSDELTLTAGNIQFFGGKVMQVAKSSVAPSDGDVVYLLYNEDWTWTLVSDADFPTDSFYIALAGSVDATEDDDGNLTVSIDDASRLYWGGDIILDGLVPVTLSKDGGSAGDTTTTCDFTYTVTTLGATEVGTGVAPVAARMANVTYSAGTCGFYFVQGGGGFGLFVIDEVPQTTTKCVAVVDSTDPETGCITAHGEMMTVLTGGDTCGT